METIGQSIQVFDFAAAQQEVHAWMKPQKVGYWGAAYMGNKLTEELREVSQELRKSPVNKTDLGKELGDVLFAVVCLANTGAEITGTSIEGVGPYTEPKLSLNNLEKSTGTAFSLQELKDNLVEWIGAVCKDIQRMSHGPKKKDGVVPPLEEHLYAVAQAVSGIADAMGVDLNTGWNDSMVKNTLRDANRWK